MNGLKAVSVVFMVLVLLVAVPVAALAIDYEASDGSGGASSLAAARSAAATPRPRPKDVAVVIRHQKRHCHAWSYNGDTYAADQTAQLTVGDSITVTNNDVMAHRLVELAGPATAITTPAMAKPSATSTITFAQPGTYLLGTKPGEDYTKGIVTTGADNVLRIKVVVT